MGSIESSASAATATPALPRQADVLLAHLRAVRSELAILLDFDGTLSPIVDHPGDARPDPAAARALEALATDLALPLVAIVTGRPALTARGLLRTATFAITGLHGAEVLAPGSATPTTPEVFTADGLAVHAIVDTARAEPEGLAGLNVEEKGPIIALHWRRSADPDAAERRARELGARAQAAGLRSGLGRSVLELRPATQITKGDGARALLAGAPAARHVLFAGDDVTDLDAVTALRAMVAAGELSSATIIAISGEGAPPQVAAAADLVLPDPAALGALLTALAHEAEHPCTQVAPQL